MAIPRLRLVGASFDGRKVIAGVVCDPARPDDKPTDTELVLELLSPDGVLAELLTTDGKPYPGCVSQRVLFGYQRELERLREVLRRTAPTSASLYNEGGLIWFPEPTASVTITHVRFSASNGRPLLVQPYGPIEYGPGQRLRLSPQDLHVRIGA